MASGGNGAKAPPILKEDGSYSQWKHALEAWQILTGIPEDKQALSVYLHGMDSKYQEVISKLEIKLLNSKDGVKHITDTLDVYCESELTQRQYSKYEAFCNIKRDPEQPVSEFLMKFENLLSDLEELEIILPDAVRAYHILKASNVGQENEKICRATISNI